MRVLTPSLICKEALRLLMNEMDRHHVSATFVNEFGPEDWGTQTHVDVLIPADVVARSLDDFSKTIILPAMRALAAAFPRRVVSDDNVVFEDIETRPLEVPPGGQHAARDHIRGVSLRYVAAQSIEAPAQTIGHFDVLWRPAAT